VDLPDVNNQFCDQIFRDPTDGFITGFRSGEINLGSVQTEGVDFTLNYGFDLGETFDPGRFFSDEEGRLTLGLLGTHFLSNDEVRDPTAPDTVTNVQGEFTLPDWIVNFNADYDIGRFGLGWRVRYESSQIVPGVSNDDLESDPDFIDISETGDSFVHDFTDSYEVREDLELYGGANNAFDRAP
jgi:outer membrane receptor protein involved in Fe transport